MNRIPHKWRWQGNKKSACGQLWTNCEQSQVSTRAKQRARLCESCLLATHLASGCSSSSVILSHQRRHVYFTIRNRGRLLGRRANLSIIAKMPVLRGALSRPASKADVNLMPTTGETTAGYCRAGRGRQCACGGVSFQFMPTLGWRIGPGKSPSASCIRAAAIKRHVASKVA